MKLQQLRYIVEVFKQGMNVSLAAKMLQTSQPGVSKQIRQLEEELGLQIFERHGKHLTKVTDAGRHLLQIAADLVAKTEDLKAVAFEHTHPERGSLTIAAADNQLRYQLPQIISAFLAQYPQVSIHTHQNRPAQIVEAMVKGEVDFAVTTEVGPIYDNLLLLPCYHVELVVVVHRDHPLAIKQQLSEEELAGYPLVTYPLTGFLGKQMLGSLFNSEQLASQIILTATDSDLLKSYVRLGLGLGLIGKMALHPQLDRDLIALEIRSILPFITTRIGFLRGKFLRAYMIDFITFLAPNLTKNVISAALEQPNNDAVEEMFKSCQLSLK